MFACPSLLTRVNKKTKNDCKLNDMFLYSALFSIENAIKSATYNKGCLFKGFNTLYLSQLIESASYCNHLWHVQLNLSEQIKSDIWNINYQLFLSLLYLLKVIQKVSVKLIRQFWLRSSWIK